MRPIKLTSGQIFLFQNLVLYMRYHNIFFAILKLYLWSIHIANNLILAISFGFKLNSNLKTVTAIVLLSFAKFEFHICLPCWFNVPLSIITQKLPKLFLSALTLSYTGFFGLAGHEEEGGMESTTFL